MEIKATDCLDTATAWIKKAASEGLEGSLHYRLEEGPRGLWPRYVVIVLDQRRERVELSQDAPDPFEPTPPLLIVPPKSGTKDLPRAVRQRMKHKGDTHVAYTDGGCWPNPGGPGGAGVVMLARGKRWERSIHVGPTTNNRAELMAVREALLMIEDRSCAVLAIGTDSLYVKGAICGGYQVKANLDLIAEVRELAAECESFRIFHVRGHAGVEPNEAADRLATEGAAHPDRLPSLNGC